MKELLKGLIWKVTLWIYEMIIRMNCEWKKKVDILNCEGHYHFLFHLQLTYIHSRIFTLNQFVLFSVSQKNWSDFLLVTVKHFDTASLKQLSQHIFFLFLIEEAPVHTYSLLPHFSVENGTNWIQISIFLPLQILHISHDFLLLISPT